MPARKQQTHAKRARELAVKERRERKQAKKALRAAGGEVVADESIGDESVGDDSAAADEQDDAAATPSAQEIG